MAAIRTLILTAPILMALAAASLPQAVKAEPHTADIPAAVVSEALAVPKSPQAPAAPLTEATQATVAVPPPKPAITLQAKVDQAKQTLTLIEGGRTIASWKVSTGVADHATPRGTFQPEWVAKMWFSRTYDMAPMPHAVFFRGGAAIHATQAIGVLGRAASHGCVRLAPANAETFYKLVQRHGLVHTRITVYGLPHFETMPVARHDLRSAPRYASLPYRTAAAAPWNGAGRISNSPFASPAYGYGAVRMR